MKRFAILAAAIVVLLFLVLQCRNRRESAPAKPDSTAEATTVTNPPDNPQSITKQPGVPAGYVKSIPVVTNQVSDERAEELRVFNESPDLPVDLYGMVVDQDTNALQNVRIRFRITRWNPGELPGTDLQATYAERETGGDGRFEFTGLTGHIVKVIELSKDGYEPEVTRAIYGEYGPHAGSYTEPILFCMWSTNLNQPLITGQKSFPITPDGRHYAIDLINGAIIEGDRGDIVAWIKRPERVEWGQRYDWSCELKVPAGGLCGSSEYAMFKAPETGYTNTFAYQEDAGFNGGGPMTGDKRFYIKLRDGQMYGRIVVDLYADYYGKQPAMIRLSYAINPSGSRILREQVPVPPDQGLGEAAGKFPAQLTWPPR